MLICGRGRRESRKRKFRLALVVLAFMGLVVYASFLFLGKTTNKELEHLNQAITTIEYKLSHDKFTSVNEKILLSEKLKKLKQDRKNIEDTKKWIMDNKTPLLEELENLNATEAIKILTSDKIKANQEKRHKDTSKELVALAKYYIQKNMFQESKNSYHEAVNEFFDYDNVLEYANFLYTRNSYGKSIKFYLMLKKEQLSKEKKATIDNNLAAAYNAINELDKAKSLYLEALKNRRILCENNPSIYKPFLATTLNELAYLYTRLNKIGEAEKFYLEALKIRKNLVNKKPNVYKSDVINTLNGLGNLYNKMDRLEESEDIHMEALNILRTQEEPDLLLTTLGYISSVYIKTNKLEEAQKIYIVELDVYKSLSKIDPIVYSINVVDVLNNLANLYSKKNQFKEAEKTYLEALEICKNLVKKKYYGSKDVMASTLNNLASVYIELEKIKEAEKASIEALKLYKVLAEKSPNTYNSAIAITSKSLAMMYHQNLNNQEEAKNLLLSALKIERKLAYKNSKIYNENLGVTLSLLGVIYDELNEQEKSEEAFLEALEIFNSLVDLLPNIKDKLDNLNLFYDPFNLVSKVKKKLLVKEKVRDKYQNLIVETLFNLAILHAKMNKYEEAKKNYYRVVKIYEELIQKNPKNIYYREPLAN